MIRFHKLKILYLRYENSNYIFYNYKWRKKGLFLKQKQF